MIKKIISEAWDWLKTFVVAFACVYLINMFLFTPSQVSGFSMEPTLQDKQWLVANKLAYLVGSPQFGDIVALENPSITEEEEFLVKRIIGVPGDTIEIKEQKVFRNGEALVESYTDVDIEGDYNQFFHIEPNQYFILGDNRRFMKSHDSRAFGPVEEDLIVGKIALIAWPVSDFKLFKEGGR